MDIDRFFSLRAYRVRGAFFHQSGIWHVSHEAMGRIGAEQDRMGVHGSARFLCDACLVDAKRGGGEGVAFSLFPALRVALLPAFVRLSVFDEREEPDADRDPPDGGRI